MKKTKGFSILCDKARDITMKKTLCVNVCFVVGEKEITVTNFIT